MKKVWSQSTAFESWQCLDKNYGLYLVDNNAKGPKLSLITNHEQRECKFFNGVDKHVVCILPLSFQRLHKILH